MKLNRKQLISLAVTCLTLLGVVIWALYAEYNRPWKAYQEKFNELEYRYTADQYQNLLLLNQQIAGQQPAQKDDKKKSSLLQAHMEAIPRRGERIKQFWFQERGETDRCTTCHQAANKKGFEHAAHPFMTHTGEYLTQHPVEDFGCVICHEGQGAALTVKDAHGEVENWPAPVLKGAYAQSSCGKCHFMDQGLPSTSQLKGAAKFTEGWKLFMKNSCLGCHSLTGYKRPDRIAPALTNISSKVSRDWLITWLKNPKDYLPGTKMPQYSLNDEDISYIADYLMSRAMLQRAPAGYAVPSNNVVIKNGKELVNSLGCLGCHKLMGQGNDFAPDLSGIGKKADPDWLYRYLKKPGGHDANTAMPDLQLSNNEAQLLTAYLTWNKNAREEKGLKETSSENIEKGKKLVKEYGCTGCHEIEALPSGHIAPELDGIGDKRVDELVFNIAKRTDKTLISWLKTKVFAPGTFATETIVTRMPDYNFTEKEGEALVTFLLSLKNDKLPLKYIKTLISPSDATARGREAIERHNCLGCHRIGNEGGNIGPDLTAEGKKSRPEWLYAFLKAPYKIRPRPIMQAGMPVFNLPDEDIRAIVKYLSLISEEPYPYSVEAKNETDEDGIWSGEKLYREVFACSGCHTVKGLGGIVGPDHTDLASRLKRQWIRQWLRDPQAIKPDVRMPRFQFQDWEFEALTNYLMMLGEQRFVRVKKDN
jgi:mono/diheme cytochrome c family protein